MRALRLRVPSWHVVCFLHGRRIVQKQQSLRITFHGVERSDGNEVRVVLAEGEGLKGPQASAVILMGKHHIVED